MNISSRLFSLRESRFDSHGGGKRGNVTQISRPAKAKLLRSLH
jgi:hypothetical protein